MSSPVRGPLYEMRAPSRGALGAASLAAVAAAATRERGLRVLVFAHDAAAYRERRAAVVASARGQRSSLSTP